MQYCPNNAEETQKIAEDFALSLQPQKEACVLCLRGELGSGKTTFLQGFGRALKVKEKIQSPTFIIMSRFPLKNPNFNNFFHFDCYRLDEPEEIIKLGFNDIMKDPKNLVAIEWPEKIEKFLPQKRTEIIFEVLEGDKRKIEVKYYE
jgi:tRNA threonylcarbamoyladenosine biosynthesis protein TsaE